MLDQILDRVFVALYAMFWLFLLASCVFAMDWSQPILDEKGQPVPDCQVDTKTSQPEPCGKVFTIGTMAARALLAPDPNRQETPENKALAGNLAIQILTHPETVPEEGKKADQLKTIKDAIGRLPSPLAVARGWAILDQAVK